MRRIPLTRRLRRWTVIVLAAVFALILTAAGVMLFSGITVELEALRGRIESVAARVLDREVHISGPIELHLALRPMLTVDGLRIVNPPGWRGANLASCELARLSLNIVRLLRGEIEIEEFTARRVQVNLETAPSGEPNWRLSGGGQTQEETSSQPVLDRPGNLELVAIRNLVLQDVTVSYDDGGSEAPVVLGFEGLTGRIPVGESLSLAAQGTFQDQPYLLQVIGGPIEDLLRAGQPWPVDAFASAVGAQLKLQGSIGDPTSGSGIDLALELSGHRLGDLAPWLAMMDPGIDLVYNVSGRINLADAGAELILDNGQLGRTRFTGRLGWRPEATEPLPFAKLHFAVFDQREIESVFGDVPKEKKSKPPMDILEWPVLWLLAEWLEVTDADLELSADRVILKPSDITQVAVAGRFRDGRMEHAPFRMTVGDTRLEGDLALDVQGDVPEAAFDLTAEQVNLGELLKRLNVARGVDASVERLRLLLRGRGATLGQLLAQSDLSVTLGNGQWILDDPDLPGKTKIQVRKGLVRSPIGEPLIVSLDGAIDRTPVKLELQGVTMQQLIDPPERVKLSLKVNTAGNRLELDGAVALPIGLSRLALDLSAEGERLDALETLLGVELPPLGPYRLRAALNVIEDGYSLVDTDFFVGSSHLYGSAELQITNQRPQLAINLSASTLQLDDFLGDSIFASISGKTQRIKRHASADFGKHWVDLFSREVMTSLNARISLKATQVLSGKDPLGNGEVVLTLLNGVLAVSPLRLKVPAGEVSARFTLSYDTTGLATEASVKAEKFDYGILARRIDPKTGMEGRLTLDMTLSSLDPDLENVLVSPTGHIHFAIWPTQFEAGVMDIWALNAFTALMSTAPEEDVSRINCIVGRFNLDAGVMDPELLVIDTTRVRAAGEGRIDLNNETLDLVVVPRVKKSKVLTLDTPAILRGGFKDFKVEVTSADLLKTTARLAFELYYLPVALLLKSGIGTIPADGFDLCEHPLQWRGDPLR